jgi:hypothetical protein
VNLNTGAVDDKCTILHSSLLSLHFLCFDSRNALLATAFFSSPCVSLNVKMSAPACLISLKAESSPMQETATSGGNNNTKRKLYTLLTSDSDTVGRQTKRW